MGKGGVATLYVDDQQVAQGRIEHTVAVRFTMSVETFDIGEDTGTPVNLSYDVPFAFTGQIDDVTIKLVPPPPETAKAHLLIEQKAAQLAVERQ